MVKHEGHLDDVIRVRQIFSDLDECQLKIGFDTYTAFYPFSELAPMKGQDVNYVLRKDIVNGKETLVITEITELSLVHTVEANKGVKLCPLNEARGVCNFDSASSQVGQYYPGSIVMVTDFKYKQSNKAKWVDLTCLDKKSKAINLRIFDSTLDAAEAEIRYKDWLGKYIRANIKYTNFGFQSEEVPTLLNISTAVSPSVALAKAIVMDELKQFPDVEDLLRKVRYVEVLERTIAPEPGWALVEIATLLNLINNIDNITVGTDIGLMKKAALLSKLHVIPTKHKYTDEVKAMLMIRQSTTLGSDDRLLPLIMHTEPLTETEAVYKIIRETADSLNSVRYMYGG